MSVVGWACARFLRLYRLGAIDNDTPTAGRNYRVHNVPPIDRGAASATSVRSVRWQCSRMSWRGARLVRASHLPTRAEISRSRITHMYRRDSLSSVLGAQEPFVEGSRSADLAHERRKLVLIHVRDLLRGDCLTAHAAGCR